MAGWRNGFAENLNTFNIYVTFLPCDRVMADPAMAGAEINKDYQIYSSLLPFGNGRKFEDFF